VQVELRRRPRAHGTSLAEEQAQGTWYRPT
jgi:hypothetical protein